MLKIINEHSEHIVAKVAITEANLNYSNYFKTELVSLLDSKRRAIWLDMEQVSYVDSSFLGSLVAGLKHALSAGNDMVLLKVQKDVHDLLKLIRLDKVFKIYTDEASATIAINKG